MNFTSFIGRQSLSIIIIFIIIIVAIHSSKQQQPPEQMSREPQNVDRTIFGHFYLQNHFTNLTSEPYYQKWIRPYGNCKGEKSSDWDKLSLSPLQVNMSLELYNYARVDEKTSEYTFQFFLDLEWCDERLTMGREAYSEAQTGANPYTFIEGGQHHIDRIWQPSFFVANNEEPGTLDYDAKGSNMVRIDLYTGRIWLRKRKVLRIYCLMDFSLFPFDRQQCAVHFESNVDNYENLILNWGELLLQGDEEEDSEPETNNRKSRSIRGDRQNLDQLAVTVNNYGEVNQSIIHKHGTFRTIGFSLSHLELTSSLVPGLLSVNYSRCSFEFVLRREFVHYITLNYIPSAIIVVVSWSTFWLEITSPPARVSLGVTTMLALVTQFMSSKSTLPTISALNVLDIWNLVCTVFIALSLIEFAVVNYIYNTPKRHKNIVRIRKKSENYRKVQGIRKEERRRSYYNNHAPLTRSGLEESINQFNIMHAQKNSQPTQDTNGLEYLAKESLARMASLNSMFYKKETTFADQVTPIVEEVVYPEQSYPELLSFTSLYERDLGGQNDDKSATTTISFVDYNDNFNPNLKQVTNQLSRPTTPVLTRKYTTNSIAPNSQSTPGTPPILRRINSNDNQKETNSRKISVTSMNSTASRGPKPNMARRKSILISHNVEVKALIECTPEQLAQLIDHISRYVFPITFAVFNVIYWIVALINYGKDE